MHSSLYFKTSPNQGMKKIKLGIGTGRCGTVSLSKMIDAKHELRPLLPWEKSLEPYQEHIKNMKMNRYVAFYYLPYLDEMFTDFDLRVVCLKRDREDTIESYLEKVPNENHWGQGNKSEWSKCYPTYDLKSKRKEIAKYYDEYYKKAREWEEKTDKFKIFPMDYLNTPWGQQEIFEHLEIESKEFKVYRYNASD